MDTIKSYSNRKKIDTFEFRIIISTSISMKRLATSLIFIVFCITVMYSQDTLTVSLSDRYTAQAVITERDDYYNSGLVSIIDNHTGKTLISEKSSVLPDPGENIDVNVIELPYGDQSLIQYDDFNFDGIKDIAIKDENGSCYGGPSYQVYIADGKGGFRYSQGFSDLAHMYCGFFSVDNDHKLIYTMTKSGCCSHWFYTFDIWNNEPRMREEVAEIFSFTNPFVMEQSLQQWDENGTKTVSTQNVLVDINPSDILFSFTLQKSGKRVILAEHSNFLYYMLIKTNKNKDETVEFSYPYFANDEQEETLTYNIKGTEETLSFANPSASYQIYNSPTGVGIRVTTKGKTYDLKGYTESRTSDKIFNGKPIDKIININDQRNETHH